MQFAFLSPFFWSTNHPRRLTVLVVFTCTRWWTREEAAMQTNQSEIQSEPKWPVEQVGVQCLAQEHIQYNHRPSEPLSWTTAPQMQWWIFTGVLLRWKWWLRQWKRVPVVHVQPKILGTSKDRRAKNRTSCDASGWKQMYHYYCNCYYRSHC